MAALEERGAFVYVNSSIMVILIVITLYPFWYVLVGSFNNGVDYVAGGVYLWPREFTFDNYAKVFQDTRIMRAYFITISRTVVGTITRVLVCGLFGFAFSRPKLRFKGLYAALGLVSMYFHAGLIPDYINIKQLGLLNNFFVYIFPRMFNFFQVIIFTAFFREIHPGVIESARMDGATWYRTYFQIIFPLSTPVVAALALFTAVTHWNAFFDSMLYMTTTDELATLQLLLMQIIRDSEVAALMAEQGFTDSSLLEQTTTSTTIQLATMIVAIGPILLVYPFAQKYFIKGIMIGSIKG